MPPRKTKQKNENNEASTQQEKEVTTMNQDAKNPFINPANVTTVNAVPVNTIPSNAIQTTPAPFTPNQDAQQAGGFHTDTSIMDITFESDIKLNVIEKFPELGKEEGARLALLAFDDKQQPMVKMCQYLFVDLENKQKLGFVIPKNPNLLAKIVRRFGEPKIRFGTIACKYFTDKNGTVMQNAQGTFDYTIHILLFGTDKWQDLKQTHAKWNLFNHDLSVKCKDQTYQKWTIIPEPDCFWKSLPNAQDLLVQAKSFYETSLKKFMPREIPDNELEIKLGFVQAPAPVSSNPFSLQTQAAAQTGATPNPFSAFVKP